MPRTIGLPLASVLAMFPQIVEAVYSTALPDIQHRFAVSATNASQTLSLFFVAFAVGIVFWGQLSDRTGRRPAMLMGLLIFGTAAAWIALGTMHFGGLLIAWSILAFGSAVGSVVTQTMLRDNFSGTDLAHVFSIIMLSLSISPALGLFGGAALSSSLGYRGVFAGMAALALFLFTWAWRSLPETRPLLIGTPPLLATLSRMLKDPTIWQSAFLVALFNVSLFSYYSLAPFMFERMGLSTRVFGYTGLIMAGGSAAGAQLNRALLWRGLAPDQLTRYGSVLTLAGGIGVFLLQDSWLFTLPVLLVVLGFGIAMPNVLSRALVGYQDRAGTAGALFGLAYYLMIGGGLNLAARCQNLAVVLVACALLALGALCFTLRLRPRVAA